MDLNLAKEFQTESLQHAGLLSELLTEASTLIQNGQAEEASEIYRKGHRELQVFHDKWRPKVRDRDPSIAAMLEQLVKDGRVNLLTSEAVAFRYRGKYDDAQSLLSAALELVPFDSFEHASLLQSIGGIRYDQQAFEQAEEFCRRAHVEFAKLASTAEPDYVSMIWTQAAQTLGESAFAAFGRGDYAVFEKTLDEAIRFAEQRGLEQVANKLWIRQVRQMLRLEASGETIQRVKLERRRRSKHSEPDFQYEVSQLIAESCAEQGEYKLARQELEEARENVPAHHRCHWLRQLSDLAEADGDIPATLEYSRQALTEAKRIGVPQIIAAALRALVPLLAAQDLSESEQCLSELRNYGDHDEIKTALVGRAIFHLQQKNFETALMDLNEAEKFGPGDPNILLGRVAVYKGMGSKEEALHVTEQAVAALEDQIRQSGIDLKSGYESLAALQESAAFWTAELGRTEEAFEWAERSKAFALRARLNKPGSVQDGTGLRYSDLQEQLANESAGLVFFCFTSRGGLALLCDGELAKPQSFFLDLTETALREILPDQESERWNQGVFGAIDSLSEKLSLLLSEIRRKGYKKLYVVPDSQLYFVPFYALNVDGDSKVLDHCAVAYLPCAQMLLSSAPDGGAERVCLAAGALQEHGISLSDQAAQIAALNWNNSECLVEATAREFLEKAPAFNVLHLQFHGRVEGSVQGSRSASILKLSDRPVSASEIYDLSLEAELVFLNACVSGRFKSRISNDVGGFWEAFLHAGAKRIIATLTYVDPESAQLVALGFYRHWLNGLDCAEALRQAQLEVRKQSPELDNWATHILIGAT